MFKKIKVLIIILVVLMFLWLLIFFIDYYRCTRFQEPIFIFSKIQQNLYSTNGKETFTYIGLGYRVIFSTIPISENEKQIVWLEMYNISDNRILDLEKESL